MTNNDDKKALEKIYQTMEEDTIEEMSFEKFLLIINASGIDLDALIKNRKRIKENDFHRFNQMLKALHDDGKISILESSIFLMRYTTDERGVMSILNDENLYELKLELAAKHGKRMKKTMNTNEFFE